MSAVGRKRGPVALAVSTSSQGTAPSSLLVPLTAGGPPGPKRSTQGSKSSNEADSTTATCYAEGEPNDSTSMLGVSHLSQARREALIRQPSYCKILDDLQDTEERVASMKKEQTDDSSQASSTTSVSSSPVHTININGTEYKVLAAASHLGPETLQTLAHPPGEVVQFAASSQNGQTVFSPATVTHAAAATSAHLLAVRSTPSTPSPAPVAVVPVATVSRSSDDSLRKREIRLMKNREAARECRNKKKEYIKCLENRVAVLENQNKALIEELKSLKEYYQVP